MNWIESLLDSLSEKGLAYSDHAVTQSLRSHWLEVLEQHQNQSRFRPAHIGRTATLQQNSLIRNDEISWLENENPHDGPILDELTRWKDFLNQSLFLSMRTVEAHFARYDLGHFYHRHIDRHENSSSRILTFIVYLHDHWTNGDGGELVVYKGSTNEIDQIIEPLPGRVVIFKSDEIWHEVRKSNIERKSLTGWFRHDSNVHAPQSFQS